MPAVCQHPSVALVTDRKQGREAENGVFVFAAAADSDSRRRNSVVYFLSEDDPSACYDLQYKTA